MPQLRKLSPDEVQQIENKGKGVRKITEEQYDTFLSDYAVGDYGEAELNEDEKRLTVRSRLKAAAKRRNVDIEFKRTQGNVIRFRVIDMGSNGAASKPARRAPKPEPEPIVPPKRKGGRPKKTA